MKTTGLVARYKMWKSYRETVRSLSRLDNHELDDLGIARGDIPRIAARAAL